MNRMFRRMTGGDARKAFTLIEMMLTIALITLLSSLFVWNITSLLKQGELESLQNELWGAVEKAKQSAVFNRQPHVVRFDEEAQAFRVSAGGKQFTFEVETDGFDEGVEIEVVFNEQLPKDGYRLVRGELVTQREIESVTFYPDGTCTPFSVNLKIGEYQSDFQIDPWTGSQLTAPEDDS
ncbi:MAG: prepilin-type N-terminal cleavage/methylation domain-containing protein [Opitutaceae bacterium]|nr:prepilin-type N-terminal cleavage/methylation domain-containing protein [Opitutaceae bacterium]